MEPKSNAIKPYSSGAGLKGFAVHIVEQRIIARSQHVNCINVVDAIIKLH
jgi:hypothetical protein